MEWDLWGPPYVPEGGVPLRQFYFGYGFDVLEEDALNEKSCMQVLRILIANADKEIDDLEKDVLSLQSELALFENEEWSEICCQVLREKNDSLDVSIQTMRNKDRNDVEVQLLMHTQPAETLDAILRELVGNYPSKKYKQCKDVKTAVFLDTSLDASRHATDVLDVNKRFTCCNSEIIAKEKIENASTTLGGHNSISTALTNVHEKPSNNMKTVKCENTSIEDVNPPSTKFGVAPSKVKELSNKAAQNSVKEEAKENGLHSNDRVMVQNTPLLFLSEGRPKNERIKAQENVDTRKDDKMPSKTSACTSNIVNSAEDAVSLDSPLKSTVKKIHLHKGIKSENVVVGDLCLNTKMHAADDSKELKLCKPDLKVTKKERVKDHNRVTGKEKISSFSLNPNSKGNCPRMYKPAGAIVRNLNAEALRYVTGFSGRKEKPASKFCPSEEAKIYNSDTEQRLCDFPVKVTRKRIAKTSMTAATSDVVYLHSSPKTKRKKINPTQILKVRESYLIDTDNCALNSPVDLRNQKGRNSGKLQQTEEGKPMRERVQMVEIDTDDNMPKEKPKGGLKLTLLKEIDLSTTMLVPSVSDCKVQQKWEIGLLEGSLKQSNGNKKRYSGNVPDALGSSSVQTDSSSSHQNETIDASADGLSVSKGYLIGDSDSDDKKLKDLKLNELRALARQHKLSKYSKLTKSLLVERLADQIAKTS